MTPKPIEVFKVGIPEGKWIKVSETSTKVGIWIANGLGSLPTLLTYFGHEPERWAPIKNMTQYYIMGRDITSDYETEQGLQRIKVEKVKDGHGPVFFQEIPKASVTDTKVARPQLQLNNNHPLYLEIQSELHKANNSFGHGYTPPKGTFRISGIAYCQRKALLKKGATIYFDKEVVLKSKKEYDEYQSPHTLGTHEAGQSAHEYVEARLESSNVLIAKEFDIPPGPLIPGRKGKVTGHPDLLCRDPQHDVLVVIDIKTTEGFDYVPKQEHSEQLLAYQTKLGGIKGALLYIDRNDYEMRFFAQDFHPSWVEPLQKKLDITAEAEEKQRLIPLTTIQKKALKSSRTAGHWECRILYCEFRLCCEREAKGLIK